ncbi:AlbA family DNA-binding domain-containing protein [Gemmatimonas sp.]|uniref:AlbA family DNA-binding domain-containing protein n=1 Tax=Gemmatimonas sp. TaxID=1962908 RepID=UPI003DA48668
MSPTPDGLAAELVAFANSGGGRLFIGVHDNGTIAGLDAADVQRINQLIGNAIVAAHVRPAVHPYHTRTWPPASGW